MRCFDFNVEITTEPDKVLPLTRAQRFDVIISDVMMPGMDGFTLGRKIRAQDETANVPIIYLTALDTVEDQFEAWLSGADAFMTKPFKAQELLKTIEKVLSRTSRPSGPLKAGRFKTGKHKARVLAAVLERDRRRLITAAMRIADSELEFTEDISEALMKLDRERFHALICDARLESGLPARLAEFTRCFALAIPVIFLHGDEGPPCLGGMRSQFTAFAIPDKAAVLAAYVRNAIDDCGWAG